MSFVVKTVLGYTLIGSLIGALATGCNPKYSQSAKNSNDSKPAESAPSTNPSSTSPSTGLKIQPISWTSSSVDGKRTVQEGSDGTSKITISLPTELKNAKSIDIDVSWSPDFKNNKGPTFKIQVYCGEKGCTLKNPISAKDTAKFVDFFFRFLNTIAKNIAANNSDQSLQQLSLTSDFEPYWTREQAIVNITSYAVVHLVCAFLLVFSARLCARNFRDLSRLRESLRIAAPHVPETQLNEIASHSVPPVVVQIANGSNEELDFPGFPWKRNPDELAKALRKP